MLWTAEKVWIALYESFVASKYPIDDWFSFAFTRRKLPILPTIYTLVCKCPTWIYGAIRWLHLCVH